MEHTAQYARHRLEIANQNSYFDFQKTRLGICTTQYQRLEIGHCASIETPYVHKIFWQASWQ
jgi:hypothetical protein